jgi:hypothetical protein
MSTDGRKGGRETTRQGYATSADFTPPRIPEGTPTERESEPLFRPNPLDHVPIVDIEVVYRHGTAADPTGPLRTLEVVTLHSTYVMDPQLLCVEVRDRKSGALDPKSTMLGMRLVGGQSRKGDAIELSYPFPRPGTEAVFETVSGKESRLDRTSTVVHVKLRLYVVSVSPQVVAPTWAEIRSSIAPGAK